MKNGRRDTFALKWLALPLGAFLLLLAPGLTAATGQGTDPWEAVEEEAERSVQAKNAVPEVRDPSFGQHGLHEGRLGHDKATGVSLEDPTIGAAAVSSPGERREIERTLLEKVRGVDPARLTFRSGVSVEPPPGMDPAVSGGLKRANGDPGEDPYCLIQFVYPFPSRARAALEEAGVVFYDYVSVSGFYAKVPPQASDVLEGLVAEGVVRHVGPIPVEARMEWGLQQEAADKGAREEAVTVLTFDEPTAAQIEELSSLLRIEGLSAGPVNIVEGTASTSALQAIASLRYVRWVERQAENTLGNFDGRMGIGGDTVTNAGFDGSGVQVMVVDTGIARDGATYHPDLLAGRVLDQYDYQNGDTNAADDNSHGTHVAGTIGGLYSGSSPSSSAWQGVAPGVDFLVYKLCCGAGQFSSTWFQQALERATSGGRTAHVSNNSWGGYNGVYNTNSEIADRAVRGEYNSHPVNMVIISHNDDDLSRAPGTGKNVITVGSVKDGNYPNDPFTSCSGVNDYDWPPGERVCYSNYGPLDIDGDGFTRVKPDVVAPGAMIFSALPWYLYVDSPYYGFKHGTSMAAPHVSGALAQILDAYSLSNAWLFDWPEVVKAMLLASTVDVGGNTDLYGRGLIDPYHAIYYQSGVDASMRFWGDSLATTGETKDFTFSVPAGYEKVVVVLAWADPAGATEVNNDLDIQSVRDATGTYGGASVHFDESVEYVTIGSGLAAGTWTIRVHGFSLSSSQTFGLAAHPILAGPSLTVSATGPGPLEPGDFFYFHQYVSNSGYTAGGSYARLYVPDGFTVQGVRIYTNDGASHYYGHAEIYHVAGSNHWRAAVGSTLAMHARHVRWYIRADPGVARGRYSFNSTAFWREEGSLRASLGVNTEICVSCGANLVPVYHLLLH